MFTWEEFKKKESIIVVHCKTEEEVKEFCEMMREHGIRWKNGDSYLEFTKWDDCVENTCCTLENY